MVLTSASNLHDSKETFKAEVEVLRSEWLESEVVIEGEYVSVATMEEWGFSE